MYSDVVRGRRAIMRPSFNRRRSTCVSRLVGKGFDVVGESQYTLIGFEGQRLGL